MGATLANNGVNPITGVRALDSKLVPKVLSVMSSCGMYDYSGAWVYEVGLPAKSGVGGGVMAVLPGQLGIAVFSPKLDERGNSVRGIAACRKISSDFGLHMLHTGRTTAGTVVRTTYNAAQIPSKRTRSPAQARRVKELGHKIVVFELQGDLVFASAEIVAAEAMRAVRDADYLILDLQRVSVVKEGALQLLGDLIHYLSARGKTALLTNVWEKYFVEKGLKAQVKDLEALHQEDIDHALEWCEDQLLAQHAFTEEEDAETLLASQVLCEGFTAEELQRLEALLVPCGYEKGACVCREGEAADAMFFILSGQVSVVVSLDHRRAGRISTLSAGSAFGEMALLDHGLRSAYVIADTPLACLRLDYQRLENDTTELGAQVRLKLVTNIARVLSIKLRQATLEIKSLRS